MKVYVVLPNNGYEGLGEPIGVYSNIHLVRIACSGAGGYRTLIIIEHDLDVPGEGNKVSAEPEAKAA